jgi:uncharacterized protein YqgQ
MPIVRLNEGEFLHIEILRLAVVNVMSRHREFARGDKRSILRRTDIAIM